MAIWPGSIWISWVWSRLPEHRFGQLTFLQLRPWPRFSIGIRYIHLLLEPEICAIAVVQNFIPMVRRIRRSYRLCHLGSGKRLNERIQRGRSAWHHFPAAGKPFDWFDLYLAATGYFPAGQRLYRQWNSG